MDWVAVDKCMLSRLLYPNPVCLLSVLSSDGNDRSLMTITWITAINNQGGFICSMNTTRYTANFMNQSGAVFVLNVPVRGMEELVLAIGSSSGSDGDKFEQLNIPICAPGGEDFQNVAKDTHETEVHKKKQKLSRKELARQEIASIAAQSVALSGLCGASVMSCGHSDGRRRSLAASMYATRRLVSTAYWDGRNFLPQEGTNVEPYLTFLGSKMFGYVQPASSVTASKGSTDA